MTPLPLPLPLALTRSWARAARAFDQRALRERVLLTLCAAVLLLWVIDQRWIDSRRLHLQALHQQLASTGASQARLQADALQLQQLIQARRQQGQAEIDTLRRQLAQAAPLFAGPGAPATASATQPSPATAAAVADSALPGLVTPQQMLPLLDELLGRQRGLRLRALQVQARTGLSGPSGVSGVSGPATTALGTTNPGATISGPTTSGATHPGASVAAAPGGTTATGSGGAAFPLYRHGVTLSVEGSYADLLAYLLALEALPQKLLWGPLTLDVEHHPQVLLKLEVYTLSMQAAWVEL